MNQTENQIRFRRAKESLATAREREAVARRAFADATESLKAAKKRYEDLFMAEENAEATRRRQA